jgi:hypothetical protein
MPERALCLSSAALKANLIGARAAGAIFRDDKRSPARRPASKQP